MNANSNGPVIPRRSFVGASVAPEVDVGIGVDVDRGVGVGLGVGALVSVAIGPR
jgi:hypothetical protein